VPLQPILPRGLALLALGCCLLTSAPGRPVSAAVSRRADALASAERLIAHQVAAMSLHEKVGQLFMISFPGSTLSPYVAQRLAQAKPGAVLLFGENVGSPDDLRSLTALLQRTALDSSGVPLIVATDQEGGAVNRVTQRVPLAPANAYWGAQGVGAAGAVRDAARATAVGLRALGVNMDLAPVVDVVTVPCNTVIGSRSFGADSAVVAQLGAAAVDGYRAGDLLSTAKHFPGYDNTCTDGHLALPTLSTSPRQLREIDLPPFAAAIGHGVDSVMLGHLVVRDLDPTGTPASLSAPIIQGTLRGTLHFHGLVLTDDLAMGAITSMYTPAQACILALRAGADMVMLSSLLDDSVAAMGAVEQAVRRGELPLSRVEEAVRRVLLAKEHAGLFDTARRGDLTRAFRAPLPVSPAPVSPAPVSPQPIKRPAPAPLPAPPAALVGAAPSVGVIQWTLPATPPAHTAYYSLQAWYYQGSSPVMVATLPRLDPGVYHSVTIRVPVSGVRYFARLSAHNMAGAASTPSPQAAVTALYDLPALPRMLAITRPAPEAVVWTWAGRGAHATYRATVFHYQAGKAVVDRAATLCEPLWRTTGLPGGLLGARYYLRVVAINPDGLATPAVQAAADVLPRPRPVVTPPGLADVGRTQTLVMWRWTAQPNAAAYRVRLSHLDAGTTVVDIDLRLPRGQTRLTATALLPGATYRLTVWAVANTGRWSAPATTQTPTLALPAPPVRDPRGPRIARMAPAGGRR